MKHSIFILLIVGVMALTAAAAFAGTDFNSSVSNSSSTLSISQINEEVGNILLRYNIGGAEINKVTDALAGGIAEEKLITLLVEVGVGKESVKAVLAEFDSLGIASEDTAAGSAAPVPSAVSPVPVNGTVCTQEYEPVCGVDGRTYSNACEAEKVSGVAIKYKGACVTYVPPKPPEPTPVPISPTSADVAEPSAPVSSVKKCGVNTYRVFNECGIGAFKSVYVQCADGYEEKLGGESSCKSSEVWQKYAQEICANRCSVVEAPRPAPGPESLPTPTPVPASVPAPQSAPAPTATPVPPITVCLPSDSLMKKYNQLTLDLQKAEEAGDKKKAEAIIQKITALKLEIERARKGCLAQPQPARTMPAVKVSRPEASRPPAPVAINRCAEVAQWENKIAHYEKLNSLSDEELKKETEFSRAEIERILAELNAGIEKVKAQCENQKTVETKPTEALRRTIAEPVRPAAVESGQEIDEYYKAKIEKITVEEDTEEQIRRLKSLREEIDELIEKLIKGRKEIEVSELGNVVSEIKVSRGEIKADDVSVKTTDKRVLVNVGKKPVSIKPTKQRVEITEIKDGDNTVMEVTATEVSIKDNALRVGDSEVKLPASEVAETLGIESRSTELREENNRAVYKFKVAAPRKLFGFIPIRITKTMTADAESSNLLGEKLPWYSFLTTK